MKVIERQSTISMVLEFSSGSLASHQQMGERDKWSVAQEGFFGAGFGGGPHKPFVRA